MVSGHTSKLVRWLVDHPVDCVILFSEDKGAPHPEGRASGKTKQEIYSVIARIVFEKDDEYGKVFKSHPTKFTDAVQNRLTILKKKYRDQACKFHQMGNGVAPKEISEGDAEYNNLLGTFWSTTSTMSVNSRADAVLMDFPWFSDLHGLWKGIPLFSPQSCHNGHTWCTPWCPTPVHHQGEVYCHLR
ncbi:hypothetical protein PAXRUDRAFT_165809 [Paxillus rubicundulus Ve08.2h10]|uniref:Uncharacterized protein n=1 Tax=Paxillus rubicundulus Ve08.2h10 TaxID=930991 RepID=A0A0D0CQV4_9AGAM|nr:hypothetical protein PAXRUDRAFT_165809 [Paxillus rubicundulus Ve08.2h10]